MKMTDYPHAWYEHVYRVTGTPPYHGGLLSDETARQIRAEVEKEKKVADVKTANDK